MSDGYSLRGFASASESMLRDLDDAFAQPVDLGTHDFRAHGEAAGGSIRVEIGAGGYLTNLYIADEWRHAATSVQLAESIQQAVRNALDDIHAQIRRAMPSPVDLSEMTETLRHTLDEIANDVSRSRGRR